MPATVSTLCYLKKAEFPYINIFTHPTNGGVLASFETLGDIHIAEVWSTNRIFRGKSNIKKALPEGFQRSEFLKNHGLIDIISHRQKLKEKLG